MVKILKLLIINWLFYNQKVILNANLETFTNKYNERQILKNKKLISFKGAGKFYK